MVDEKHIEQVVSLIDASEKIGSGPIEIINTANRLFGIDKSDARKAIEIAVDRGLVAVDIDLKLRTPKFVKDKNTIGSVWP